jgi:hypothetical protein
MILNAGPDLNIVGVYGRAAVIGLAAEFGVEQCEPKPYGLGPGILSWNDDGCIDTRA